MRKTMLALVSLFAAASPARAQEFMKTFSTPGTDTMLWSAVPLPDGTSLATGSFTQAGAPRVAVSKLGPNGGLIFKKGYKCSSDAYASEIVALSGGASLVVGLAFSGCSTGPLTGWHVVVLLLNSSGNLIWARTLGAPGTQTFGQSVTTTSDGGFAITGIIYSASGNDGFVAKLNGAGGLVWGVRMHAGSDDRLQSITEFDEGGTKFLAAVGSSDGVVPTLPPGKHHWVVKLSSSGAPLYSRSYDVDVADELRSIRGVPGVQPGYVAVGVSGPGIPGNNRGVVMKLASNLSPSWVRRSKDTGEEFNAAAFNPADTSIIVAGTTGWDGWLLNLDTAGNTLWGTDFGGMPGETFESVAPTVGGYLAAGRSSLGWNSQLVVRTDLAGDVGTSCSLESDDDQELEIIMPPSDNLNYQSVGGLNVYGANVEVVAPPSYTEDLICFES